MLPAACRHQLLAHIAFQLTDGLTENVRIPLRSAALTRGPVGNGKVYDWPIAAQQFTLPAAPRPLASVPPAREKDMPPFAPFAVGPVIMTAPLWLKPVSA